MEQAKLRELIAQMTLEEKAGMCSGQDFWHTKAVERLGIPAYMVSDGPHGLRKQDEEADHLGVNDSIKAVCFPTACATSASFDRELLREMGEALGKECQAVGVGTILGPAANIKRSPLCGRNFEYFSEDPYLATEIAGAHIEGVQSQNVGTSLKHYLANNQEYRRLTSSSEIDERTLREIYLAAFEGAVKKQKPWTVMCSYNRVNGLHVADSREFLTDILRDEWGFDGYVMSDWGAVNDRVKGLEAGLELEMPASRGENDKLIVEAVKNGTLDEKVLDQAVERILNIVYRYTEQAEPDTVWNMNADHELSRRIEEECIVLLKNEQILPLENRGSIAFIGKYAEKPRFQGGGSSHINCFKVESAMDAVNNPAYGIKANISYTQGYEDERDEIDKELVRKAVVAASQAEAAVIFAGLPDNFESEGYDRKHMSMPQCQDYLISEVAKVQPNTIVVLHNGSPVEMPWIDQVKAVVEVYLGGQAVGGAAVNVLFGKVNPCGKLAETFPLRVQDNPSYLNFPGEKNRVEYREGIFVGYRYYDKREMNVLFPFGHGLSYTTFSYGNLRVSAKKIKDTDTLIVSADIKNTGKVAGKEAVQLYVRNPQGTANRPVRELRGFTKVFLKPGQTKTVTFELEKRAFSYFNTEIHDWYAESGIYGIEVAASSRDIRLEETVAVESTVRLPFTVDFNTTLDELLEHPEIKEVMDPLLKNYMPQVVNAEEDKPEDNGFSAEAGWVSREDKEKEKSAAEEAISEEMQKSMMEQTPIRGNLSFGNGSLTRQMLAEMIDKANAVLKK